MVELHQVRCRQCRQPRMDDGTRCKNCGVYQNKHIQPMHYPECPSCGAPRGLKAGSFDLCVRCGAPPPCADQRYPDKVRAVREPTNDRSPVNLQAFYDSVRKTA